VVGVIEKEGVCVIETVIVPVEVWDGVIELVRLFDMDLVGELVALEV